MRRALAFASMFSVLGVSTASFAQDAEQGAPDARTGVGGDLQLVVPLGDFATASGMQIGPLLRIGYRVVPAVEITVRGGYLYGVTKTQGEVKTSVSNVPVWGGVRYFFTEPSAGLYAAAEAGLNAMRPKFDGVVNAGVGSTAVTDSNWQARFGFNVGVGYVVAKDLPFDFRAQFMHHNLIGGETGEKPMLGIGLSGGYTATF